MRLMSEKFSLAREVTFRSGSSGVTVYFVNIVAVRICPEWEFGSICAVAKNCCDCRVFCSSDSPSEFKSLAGVANRQLLSNRQPD